MDANTELAAMAEGWKNFLSESAKSEALKLVEWARLYDVSRNNIRDELRKCGGEPFGGKWRVPLSECPPIYFAERAVTFDKIFQKRRT
jgi:hypothetical protein